MSSWRTGGSSGGTGAWGSITGTLSNQIDLQTALNLKENTANKGTANGYAELDSGGKVPTAQLPSYVDDVLTYANLASFPVTGVDGIIYIAINTNLTYRWSGSAYVEISASLALGETSATAYRGDRGKTAYDHSQIVTGNPHGTSATDIGLGNVDNTSDINKPVSTAQNSAIANRCLKSANLSDVTNAATARSNLGLGNVDNTSDVNKPISTATQTALDLKAPKTRAPAITQSATPTINTNVTDVAHITGLAQAITSFTTNLSGTPVEGDMLRIDITDNGTGRAITWGASFEASGTVALPTTTVASTRLDTVFVWNTVTSKWRIVGTA